MPSSNVARVAAPLRRLAFPFQQAIRDGRQPTRSRNATVRAGMALDPLPGWSKSITQWVGAAIGLPARRGPVWAVVVAKDEQVRLPGAIRHLIDQGVDHVVVADNGSTDGMADVVAAMADELPITLLQDLEPGYYQARKVSRLARAATRRGASWIVPFDADELWYGAGHRLTDVLRGGDADIYPAPMFDHRPALDGPDCRDPYVDIVTRTVLAGPSKAAFRANLFASVHQGNHWVNQPGAVRRGALEIRHFPILGFEHLRRKLTSTVDAYRRTDLPTASWSYVRDWVELDDDALRAVACPPGEALLVDPAPLGPDAIGTILVRTSAS